MRGLSLNALAGALVDRMVEDAARAAHRRQRAARSGETLIDCGAAHPGGIEAGLRLAAICMGGLGTVDARAVARRRRAGPGMSSCAPRNPVDRLPRQPVCRLGADGTRTRRSSSRSARGRRARSPAASRLSRSWRTAKAPTAPCSCSSPTRRRRRAVVEKVAARLRRSRRTGSPILFAPTRSLAGSVQIVARVVEVALHKAHALKFPLDRIVDAVGSAPLSPPHPDFADRHGPHQRRHHLRRQRAALRHRRRRPMRRALAAELPSSASRDYGAPVRRDLQALRRRFLRDRSDAVQPGARSR